MKSIRKSSRAAVVSVALTVASIGYQPDAQAILPVTDALHIQVNLKTQIDAVIQYAKQVQGMAADVEHYQQSYAHYQQQLIKLKRMVSSLSFSGSQALAPVPLDFQVEQRCRKKPSGLSLKSLVSALAAMNNDDIIEQQRTICEAIQMNQNMAFNETVDFLTRVRQETQEELSAADKREDTGGETQGSRQSSSDDRLSIGLRLDSIYRDYNSKLEMYRTSIASLQDMQRTYARSALKGEDNPLGTIVKTGALETALSVGK